MLIKLHVHMNVIQILKKIDFFLFFFFFFFSLSDYSPPQVHLLIPQINYLDFDPHQEYFVEVLLEFIIIIVKFEQLTTFQLILDLKCLIYFTNFQLVNIPKSKDQVKDEFVLLQDCLSQLTKASYPTMLFECLLIKLFVLQLGCISTTQLRLNLVRTFELLEIHQVFSAYPLLQ